MIKLQLFHRLGFSIGRAIQIGFLVALLFSCKAQKFAHYEIRKTQNPVKAKRTYINMKVVTFGIILVTVHGYRINYLESH